MIGAIWSKSVNVTLKPNGDLNQNVKLQSKSWKET